METKIVVASIQEIDEIVRNAVREELSILLKKDFIKDEIQDKDAQISNKSSMCNEVLASCVSEMTDKGMTCRQIAEKLGISKSKVNEIQHGFYTGTKKFLFYQPKLFKFVKRNSYSNFLYENSTYERAILVFCVPKTDEFLDRFCKRMEVKYSKLWSSKKETPTFESIQIESNFYKENDADEELGYIAFNEHEKSSRRFRFCKLTDGFNVFPPCNWLYLSKYPVQESAYESFVAKYKYTEGETCDFLKIAKQFCDEYYARVFNTIKTD